MGKHKKRDHKYCLGKKCDEDRHIINVIALVMGAAGPLSAIPQVWMTYSTHDVSGVSIWAWAIPMVFCIVMIIYGRVHRLLPVIINNTLWLIMCATVVIGVIIYS